MPTQTGLDKQAGYAIESTWGTAVTVSRFLPLVDSTMKKEIEPVESAGIRAGRQVITSQDWDLGNATVGGDINHEVYTQSWGLLLRATFGTVSTVTAGGTSVHTFWPASPSVSFTYQEGRPNVQTGSVIPFTYEGCKVSSAELAFSQGEALTWGMTVVAKEERMGTALAAVSYNSDLRKYIFKHATLSIDGTVIPVKSGKVSIDNKLAERRFVDGGTVIAEPLRNELASYTGEFETEWGLAAGGTNIGTMLYDRFLKGTESALKVVFASGTLSGTISANVRFNGSTPEASGGDPVKHVVPWSAVASGTLDSTAITVTLTNNDSTP